MGHRCAASGQQGAEHQGWLERFLYLSRRLRKHYTRLGDSNSKLRHGWKLVRLANRPEDGGIAGCMVRGARPRRSAEDLRGDAGGVLAKPALCAAWHVCSANRVPQLSDRCSRWLAAVLWGEEERVIRRWCRVMVGEVVPSALVGC